jgi:hypothetical protein
MPFYVGCTSQSFGAKLSLHIHDSRGLFTAKSIVIMDIIGKGKKPLIRLLHECDEYSADYYESFFYDCLKNQGFALFQKDYAFNSRAKLKNLRWLRPENLQIKKYLQICYKNTLIIIW